MELKQTISKRLKKLREDADATQAEVLADLKNRLGVELTQGHLSSLERPNLDKLPSLELLVALASVYETSVDYILGRTDNSMSPADIEEELQTGGLGGRIGDVFGELAPSQRQQVLDFATALLTIQKTQQPAMDGETRDLLRKRIDIAVRRGGLQTAEKLLDRLAREFPELLANDPTGRDGEQQSG